MLREYWPLEVKLSHDFTQYHKLYYKHNLEKSKALGHIVTAEDSH